MDQVTFSSEESAVTSRCRDVNVLNGLGVRPPLNGIDFDMHSCFLSGEPRSLYATHWVAPIVFPYEHDGYLRSCDFYSFSDVFPTAPASEFLPYIKIATVSGDPYNPDDTDFHLPKAFREFSHCARCGRKAMDDCWAMGAMMGYDNQAVTEHTHLACVYCATYQAITDCVQSDWWEVLQLQELPRRKAALTTGINRTLLYLQGAITASVIGYKRQNSGFLPTHVRSTYVRVNDIGMESYPTGLKPDYEHYIQQQTITNFDLRIWTS